MLNAGKYGVYFHAGRIGHNIRIYTAKPDIAINSNLDPSFVFSYPLAFFAVGIHKGDVDYDELNARMSPENRGQAEVIVKQLENWDNELQLAEIAAHDPCRDGGDSRPGAININERSKNF